MDRLWFGSSLLTLLSLAHASRAQEFSVHRSSDDSVVFSASLSPEVEDVDTRIPIRIADFSSLEEPGEYTLVVPGIGKSVSFRIGPDVYDGELVNAMLGFYGWRSGLEISFDHHGVHYQHAAGHLSDGWLDYIDGQVGVHKDGVGGWYDAGDYGKYLPSAADGVCTLLAAWELFGERLRGVELPFIPEHGGPLPDFLSEIRWELDWLLRMTYDDGSGRVHHKLNSPTFPGFVLPANDPTRRYFASYSTAATAEFVATTAKAARAFAPYDPAYSERLLQAARSSYAYLQANPDNVRYDSSVLAAGEYQKDDADDRLWAAAEMWETTEDPAALADLEGRITTLTTFVPNFSWDTSKNFGLLTYLLSRHTGRNPDLVDSLTERLDATARGLVQTYATSGYGRALHLYYWGTNGVIARTCMILQTAHVLRPNSAYLDVCAAQIAYLYGRNQYNRSQVTGSGIAPPLNPHHRPSGSDQAADPYPGLLVGGGQSATNWRDLQGSFATNEVAINWNAPLVYALAGFIQGEGASPSLGRGPVPPADCGVRVSSVGYLSGRSKFATVQSQCELPNSFQCQLGEKTMSGDTQGPLKMIDDFEDQDQEILPDDGRQGRWFAFTDNTAGTHSGIEVNPAQRPGSEAALCISGSAFTSWGGGIGFPLSQPGDATTRKPYDATNDTGLSFWARGSSTSFRVMLVDKYSDPASALCTSCYDHFQFTFTPTSSWQKFSFTWKDATQLGFGDIQPSVCPVALYAIQFQWLAGDTFELCLDDVAFTTAQATPADLSDPVPAPAAPNPSAGAAGTVTPVAEGGCGCRVSTTPTPPWGAGLGLSGVWLGWLRRRRPNRRSPVMARRHHGSSSERTSRSR